MFRLIGTFALLNILFSCTSTAERQLVDEKSWENFLGSGRGGSDYKVEESCRIHASCQALKRTVVSCDAETAAVGCGACLPGFIPSKSSTDASATPSQCLPASSSSLAAALDAEKLIDNLAISSSMDDKNQDKKDSPPMKKSGGPGDDGAGSTSSPAAPTQPPLYPPPHSPPIRRLPPGSGDFAFYVIIGATCGLGVLLIIFCAICVYIYVSSGKQAAEKGQVNQDYPAHSSGGGGASGDGKLALSAQMYHYQHQKQQMLAMESRSNSDLQQDASDDSDLENDEADFTVYECPGLATTKEMEVHNPLFKEDPDTAQSATSAPPTSAGQPDGAFAGEDGGGSN